MTIFNIPEGVVIGAGTLRAAPAAEATPPLNDSAIREIEFHLGGDQTLRHLHAGPFVVEGSRLSFTIAPRNASGIRAVAIEQECDGFYRVEGFGARPPGFFSAPLIASAHGVVPENFATVLGQWLDDETLHHRHF